MFRRNLGVLNCMNPLSAASKLLILSCSMIVCRAFEILYPYIINNMFTVLWIRTSFRATYRLKIVYSLCQSLPSVFSLMLVRFLKRRTLSAHGSLSCPACTTSLCGPLPLASPKSVSIGVEWSLLSMLPSEPPCAMPGMFSALAWHSSSKSVFLYSLVLAHVPALHNMISQMQILYNTPYFVNAHLHVYVSLSFQTFLY